MSGTRATLTLVDGAKVDEAALKAAVESRGVKFKSFTSKTSAPAAAAYVISAPGLT